MPWRGPDEPGAFPTLGYEVAEFIEAHCAIPDGDHVGEAFRLTDEMLLFLLWFYRIDPETGTFFYSRGGQLVRPQKWGKGPLSAAIVCAEAEGPVRPAGWDARGEPVGRSWATPLIQITAVSEDQTDNVWRALVPMIELGGLQADIPDTGETRINLARGGRIEPVTSAASSRLGQRITHAIQDETHAWLARNGGRKLADTQRRNLAGMGGRFLETTNAWDPLEESVAQQTAESNEPGVYRDDVEPGPGSIRNKAVRRRLLRQVYGDSLKGYEDVPGWVDLDRIDGEIEALLPRDPVQAERFFLNRKRAEAGAAFDIARWRRRADPTIEVPAGTLITIGVDGARFDDALALVGSTVAKPHQFVLGIWEVPDSERDNDDYEHPFDEVDAIMSEAFERWDPWRVYIDPERIEGLVDRWQGRWGEKRILQWLMNRPRPTAYMLRAYATAIHAGDFTNDGDPTMDRHIANARKQKLNVFDEEHRQMWTIKKDRPGSPRKIDGAAAGGLSWEARGDAIAAGAKPKGRKRAVFL